MGARFGDANVKSIQGVIKYACDRLEKVGFDSVVLITSKEIHMELGSTKGRRFIEDYPNYFEDFIHYCRVKIETEMDDIPEADAYEETKAQVSVPEVITVGPGKRIGKLLTPKEEPTPSKITDMTDANSQEIDFTIEVNTSFHDAIAEGDESGLKWDIEIDQSQDHAVDTNKSANKIAKRYSEPRKGHADEADKKLQVSVPTVITLPCEKIGKLQVPKNEPSEISEMSDVTSQEIDCAVAIADSLNVVIDDRDESGLDEELETDQKQDQTIDTNKIANPITESYNKLSKGKKAQSKQHKVIVRPAHERSFDQQIEKQEEQGKSKRSSSTPERTFDCDQCDKTYVTKKSLTIHQRKHTGDAPYACPTCDKTFRCSSFLKSHAAVHSTELEYSCDKCDKLFARKESLRRHRISIHSNDRRHVCDTCGSCFKDPSALRKHTLRHIGEKNHSCEVCGKLFVFKYQMSEHMRVHTGIKRFECGICDQRFTTKSSALKHQNKQHPPIYVTKCRQDGNSCICSI